MSDTPDKSPFNSPQPPAQAPYHLRNGIADRAEIDRHEADHRRRLGMEHMQSIGQHDNDRARFDAWMTSTYPSSAPPISHVVELMWSAWQAAQR